MAPNRPKRPKWLVGEGRKEWERVAPKLFKQGLLTELYRVHLAFYCQSYADYLAALTLARTPLIKTKNGNVIQNPAVGVMNQARKACMEAGAKFGLNPTDLNNVQPAEAPTAEDKKSKFFVKRTLTNG